MPHIELEYPKQAVNTVKRLPYRVKADYALETIHTIINSSTFLHVSFTPPGSPYPVILPMIGKMGSFERPSADAGDVLDLYLHGYVSARMMNVTRDAAGSASSGEEAGLAVAVCASHCDGLVLSLTPNSHSFNYRSAVLFGRAVPVTDVPEKLWAMELITDGVVRGRWANTRVPPNGAEMASTQVLRVRIASGSAKIRTGMPSDEREDAEDAELVGRVWTGLVPVYTTLGEPVPSPENKVADVPEYLSEYIAGQNEANKEDIHTAITKKMDKSKGKSED